MGKKCILYKYVSAEGAKNIIEFGEIWLKDGSDFNDPFELLVTDSKNGTVKRIKGLRILCLTSGQTNRLMWAHYANEHKGVCLAIEVPVDLVYAVCYTKTRTKSDNVDNIYKNHKSHAKKNLIKEYHELSKNKKIGLLKDGFWSYENEYRIIFEKNEKHKDYYSDGIPRLKIKITTVYLGAKMEKKEKETIVKLCKKKTIPIKEIQLSKTEYKMKVVEYCK